MSQVKGRKRRGHSDGILLWQQRPHSQGGGLIGGWGGPQEICRKWGTRPGTGLSYLRFSLNCNQLYAVIHVTKKEFYGVGERGGGGVQ